MCPVGQTPPISLIVVVALLATLAGCGQSSNVGSLPTATSTSVRDLLKEDLWSDRDAYDATHYLMVPLHASFGSDSDPRRLDFDAFVTRFLDHSSELTAKRLDRLQFTYLVSRYGVLKSERDGCTQETARVRSWLDTEIDRFLTSPAWQWAASAFLTVPDRIAWRLSPESQQAQYEYQGALIDEDLFALAIAADAQTLDLACGAPSSNAVDRTVGLAADVFEEKVVSTSAGGWLLQPGVWSDHPDYLYAGNENVEPDLQPAPIADIATDTSHSARLPLFLRSLQCNAEVRTDQLSATKYEQLVAGLDAQFAVVASRANGGILMTNFMDGRNGVYRYGYATQGADQGYGPYQLSGTFNLGWWTFAGDRAHDAYEAQLNNFPFSDEILKTYIGPDTTRDRNPAFGNKTFLVSPLQKEILVDAAQMSGQSPCHEPR